MQRYRLLSRVCVVLIAAVASGCVETAECDESLRCPEGEVCYEFECRPRCEEDADCGEEAECLDCVDSETDDNRCFGEQAQACVEDSG